MITLPLDSEVRSAKAIINGFVVSVHTNGGGFHGDSHVTDVSVTRTGETEPAECKKANHKNTLPTSFGLRVFPDNGIDINVQANTGLLLRYPALRMNGVDHVNMVAGEAGTVVKRGSTTTNYCCSWTEEGLGAETMAAKPSLEVERPDEKVRRVRLRLNTPNGRIGLTLLDMEKVDGTVSVDLVQLADRRS